jgi:hypothetical protein
MITYCCLAVVVVEMSDDHVPYIAIQTDTVENNDKFKSGHLLQTNLRDCMGNS